MKQPNVSLRKEERGKTCDLAFVTSFNRVSVNYRCEAPFIFLYQKFQLRRKDLRERERENLLNTGLMF